MNFSEQVVIKLTEEELKNYKNFRKTAKPVDIEDDMFDRQLFLAGASWLSTRLSEEITAAMLNTTSGSPEQEPSNE